MTLAFPQPMIDVGVDTVSFEPERVDYLAPEAGGALGAMTAGLPRWTLRMTFAALRDEHADRLRAWRDLQRGAQRSFVAWDIGREAPLRHACGRPYNPDPTSWAQVVDADGIARLTLTGLLAGQTVSIGDYIGFAWAGGRLALTRSCERAIAGGVGSVTVAVEPPLPPVVPAGATATLRRAACLMRLVPGETKIAERGLNGFGSGTVIVAAQDLIR